VKREQEDTTCKQLQTSTRTPDICANDCDAELSDVEKVAKGIVDVNLFITSQVILPALERYRLEQNQQPNEGYNGENDSMTRFHDSHSDYQLDRKTYADKQINDPMTIRVDNGAGIYLIDTVMMY
jgi:hypothetical protein